MAITKCFWTHAQGEAFGWWARATKEADLDDNGKLVPKSSWTVEVSGAKTLNDAREQLSAKINAKMFQGGK